MVRELIFVNIPEVNVCVKACNSYSSIGLQLAETHTHTITFQKTRKRLIKR